MKHDLTLVVLLGMVVGLSAQMVGMSESYTIIISGITGAVLYSVIKMLCKITRWKWADYLRRTVIEASALFVVVVVVYKITTELNQLSTVVGF